MLSTIIVIALLALPAIILVTKAIKLHKQAPANQASTKSTSAKPASANKLPDMQAYDMFKELCNSAVHVQGLCVLHKPHPYLADTVLYKFIDTKPDERTTRAARARVRLARTTIASGAKALQDNGSLRFVECNVLTTADSQVECIEANS